MLKIIIMDLQDYKYQITKQILSFIMNDKQPPIIMCVGCAKIQGDSLGPITGNLLIEKYNIRTYVYGTIKRPLTASNVISVYNFVKYTHNSKILVIDAAATQNYDYGKINIFKGGIKPAAAYMKNLPRIGDYSITCNINMFFKNSITLMQNDNDNINQIAENIAIGINDALTLYKAYSNYVS